MINSDTKMQTSLPDIPYEPDLDIEIDFPRGISAIFSTNVLNEIVFMAWLRSLFGCDIHCYNIRTPILDHLAQYPVSDSGQYQSFRGV